ncbi:MAG: HRDC domain-containing protein [Chloroflexi bacterium]|nr:HRDC domain-containing protein [Chloroflexota bacterium]
MTLAAARASGLVDITGRRLLSHDAKAPIDMKVIAEHKRYAEERLEQMEAYAQSSMCRHAQTLRYFGEEAPAKCSACDNCLRKQPVVIAEYPHDLYDSLLEVRDQLAREMQREPDRVFQLRTAQEIALYRPRDRNELTRIWGIRERRADWYGERLLETVRRWERSHPGMARASAPPPKTKRQREADEFRGDASSLLRLERLRAWRRERAERDRVFPYQLFWDRTLHDIVKRQPRTVDDLARMNGVGEEKARRFGEELLELVKG